MGQRKDLANESDGADDRRRQRRLRRPLRSVAVFKLRGACFSLRFLSEISSQLRRERGLRDVADRIGEYAQILAPVSALLVAPWLAPLIAASGRLIRRREKPPPSAQEQREKVCEALRALNRRLVILIDDVDRLEGAERADVVRLVKLVGAFLNTTYVLAYDQARVARALDETEHEGQAFLEKIVQLSYEVPSIDPTQLGRGLGAAISAAVGDLTRFRFSQDEYTNLFADARLLFSNLRDVRRYTNVLPSTLSLSATRWSWPTCWRWRRCAPRSRLLRADRRRQGSTHSAPPRRVRRHPSI